MAPLFPFCIPQPRARLETKRCARHGIRVRTVVKCFLLFLFMGCLVCNAQIRQHIFSEKVVQDKFEDVESQKHVKTLISITDTTIEFEEKGSSPQLYYLMPFDDPHYTGSKDNPVNLIENTYGYEVQYTCLDIPFWMYRLYFLTCEELYAEEKEKKQYEFFLNHVFFITHRVITSKYTGEFLAQAWWITAPDGSRSLYKN